MTVHNPITFANSLGAKLASRSRHVCVFLGAGSSKACGLPDVAELKDKVLAGLNAENKAVFENQLADSTFEGALTRIRRISALLKAGEEFDGLTLDQAKNLDAAVCEQVVAALDLDNANLEPMFHFASWAARTAYKYPVEVFTVNYDLLIEEGFDRVRVPYFDGFIGTVRAGFYTELVESRPGLDDKWIPAFFLRLWKLHGAVNWVRGEDRQIQRLGHAVRDNEAAAIFPSDTKYEESRRVPFVVLQDRFRRALSEPESLILISGYSFGDEHLNDMIFEAAARHPRSEFLAFCYGEIPEALAKRAINTPNLQALGGKEAIIACSRREWEAPTNTHVNVWPVDQFGLQDFAKLSRFLAQIVPPEEDNNPDLKLILEALVGVETDNVRNEKP